MQCFENFWGANTPQVARLTIYVRVTALRAAQNALAGRMQPAGRSLPTSAWVLTALLLVVFHLWFNTTYLFANSPTVDTLASKPT